MAKEYFVKEEDIDILKDNVDNKISSPNTAEVGQILSVKAIDGNGKPTEWEVINKPGSGPGESSPYIYMTQEEYEALTEYEQDKMYWVTYPLSNCHLIWKNGEAFGLGAIPPADTTIYKYNNCWVMNYNPPTVSSIKYSSFTNSTFKYIDTTYNVTLFPEYSFANSINLEEINIRSSVTNIGSYAFSGCTSLKSMVIPNSVTNIGAHAFSGCTNLKSMVIPDSVTSIENSTFADCSSLINIIIPDSVTSIGADVFSGCSTLTNIDLSQITGLDSRAFQDCSSLKIINIPKVKSIRGSNEFKKCSALTTIDLPSIESIGCFRDDISYSPFMYCTNLQSVTIGSSCKSIHTKSFYECNKLTTITINKPAGSISGAPWGATNATVIWNG